LAASCNKVGEDSFFAYKWGERSTWSEKEKKKKEKGGSSVDK